MGQLLRVLIEMIGIIEMIILLEDSLQEEEVDLEVEEEGDLEEEEAGLEVVLEGEVVVEEDLEDLEEEEEEVAGLEVVLEGEVVVEEDLEEEEDLEVEEVSADLVVLEEVEDLEVEEMDREVNPHHQIKKKTTATLFVANLPYEIDDEGLAQLFSKFPEFKTAHVVRSMRGKPRGYGFVEFQSENAQLTALKEMDGKNIEGKYGERKIMVKVATKRGQEMEEPEEKSNENE